MLQNVLILRTPKESEMALSNQVKQCVVEASSNLREALAFAARTEHPAVINMITDILVRMESIESMEEIMDKFAKPKDIPHPFG